MSAPILFDGCKETDVKISTTCLALFDSNNYSVACSCAGKVVQCKSYADKVIFIHNGVEVGRHERRFTRGQTYYNPKHYFPILAQKPGALRNGAPFVDMVLPDELNKVRQHLETQVNGARDFAHILSYISLESLESVVIACKEAIKSKTITENYPKIHTAAPDIEIILSIASSEGLYSSKNRSTLYLDSRALMNCRI